MNMVFGPDDHDGFIAASPSSVAALSETADQLTEEFVAEMGDTSNFGLAKSLMARSPPTVST